MSFWIIMLATFLLLVVLVGFLTLNRYIGYKERVALAQLGFSLEDLNRDAGKKYGNRGVLWGGVITAMSGLALLLGLATIGTGAWLLAGLLPLFVGLGMVVIYFLTLEPAPLGARRRGSGELAKDRDLVPSEDLSLVSDPNWPGEPVPDEETDRR